jgi:hypothetical protein
MSKHEIQGLCPDWLLTPAPEGSYRSIFRWGDPHFSNIPRSRCMR